MLLLTAVYIISMFPIFPGYDLIVNKHKNLLSSWLIDKVYHTLSHPDTVTNPIHSRCWRIKEKIKKSSASQNEY